MSTGPLAAGHYQTKPATLFYGDLEAAGFFEKNERPVGGPAARAWGMEGHVT